MTGLSALVRMWAARDAGHDEVPPVIPAHLVDAPWRFPCRCPTAIEATASAVIRQARVAPPRRFCATCRTWNDGVPVSR